MEGCKQMGHFWNLSNYREALIQPLKVNSPKTKKPQPHVVHKNALEWSTRGWDPPSLCSWKAQAWVHSSIRLPLMWMVSWGSSSSYWPQWPHYCTSRYSRPGLSISLPSSMGSRHTSRRVRRGRSAWHLLLRYWWRRCRRRYVSRNATRGWYDPSCSSCPELHTRPGPLRTLSPTSSFEPTALAGPVLFPARRWSACRRGHPRSSLALPSTPPWNLTHTCI